MGAGTFRFVENGGYIPEYVKTMRDMIHVVENDKLNEIGDQPYSLSMNWFKQGGDNTECLKKNLYNFFRHHCGESSSEQKMWSTYKDAKHLLKGKGYTNGFVPFNKKATNEFKDKNAAA